MPSSTFSSSRLLAVTVVAVAIAASLMLVWEQHWHQADYPPMIYDDRNLWSVARDRAVRQDQDRLLAISGASRIQAAWSPRDFRQLQPGWESVSVAINGHYPMAVIHDLAADQRFAGLLLVTVDARGLARENWSASEPWVRHYHRDFGPQRRIERWLATRVQTRLVSAGADFNLIRRIEGWIRGSPPHRHSVHTLRDRTMEADFQRAHLPSLRNWFVELLAEAYREQPAPPPDQWLADLDALFAAVERIRDRGGQVVFLRMPTSDGHWELDQANYPREDYWDRFAARVPALAIHFQDEPALAELETPDTSHIDFRDRPRFTAAVVDILRREGLLPEPGD